MKAPERFLEQSNLGDLMRADLNAAREQSHDPSFDVDAGLVTLKRALDGSSGGGGSGSTPPSTPSKEVARSGAPSGGSSAPINLPKLFLLAGTFGAAGLLLWFGLSQRSPVERAASLPVHHESRETMGAPGTPDLSPPDGSEGDEAVSPRPAQPSLNAPAQKSGANLPAPPALLDSSPAPATRQEVAAPSPKMSEVAHLAEVRRALASDPNRALALATEGHQQFQSGFLFEEREGLAILALQKTGRSSEAKSRARAYQRRFPKSALLPSMSELLEGR